MRIAVCIEYDGSAYNGWQRQKSGIGVQELVERALSRVADHDVDVVCAGRTDAGVHATAQVAHFDTDSERAMHGWLLGANSNLPDDINVCWSTQVADDFHARYSATSRTYRYLILNRLVRSALFRHRAWWLHEPLDASRMQAAAGRLLGRHDFSAFRAAGCQAANAVRDVQDLTVRRHADWVSISITANAFLQHMVRNVAGLLVAIGSGERESAWASDVLDGRDRTAAGIAAPAHGLTLVRVDYPERFYIPTRNVSELLPGVD